MSKARVIAKYLGPVQHIRILTIADQVELGAEPDEAVKDLVWDGLHGHRLNVADAPEAVLLFLEASEQFEVVRNASELAPAEDDAPAE